MKRVFFISVLFSFLTISSYSQFKTSGFDKPSMVDGITKNDNGLLFGFIDPNKFSMNHTIGASFSSFGEQGMALTTYTNSMRYQFSSNLNMRVDASIVHSPFNSFGKDLKDFSGIYVSRAELNYKPFDNMNVTVQYRNIPLMSGYGNPYYGYGSSFRGFNGFSSFDEP